MVVANWKLNPQTLGEARNLASQIELGLLPLDRSRVEVVICPPAVFLPVVAHAVHFVRLGAQNISAEQRGPFTGEISAAQVSEFRASYAILGHSERRALGEDDKFINRKLKAAVKGRLEPILCVGSGTKANFTAAAIKRVITRQIQEALVGVRPEKIELTLAYEPVWAISRGLGTGKAVSPAHAAEIISYIGLSVPSARVIYGGSVDGANAADFARQPSIQGALVGGASLNAQEFLKVSEAFSGT